MDSKVIYKDLAKMLNKIKTEKDLSEELVSVLTLASIDAATKTLMNEHHDMSRTEALLIARMKSLELYDEFIFNDRLENIE